MIDSNAVSSWQSSNPRRDRYQGAVLFPRSKLGFDVLSVSAYEEPVDEAIALVLGREMQFGGKAFAERVAQISGNKHYPLLCNSFYG